MKQLGMTLTANYGRELVETGIRITNAANEQLRFTHPTNPKWKHFSFCQITGPLENKDDVLTGKNTVVIQPGKLDRSPTGTGCSARMALLHLQGKLSVGDQFIGKSIIDTEFHCQIKETTKVGNKTAIVPIISGRVWVTGTYQHFINHNDPFPLGYQISDTWPKIS